MGEFDLIFAEEAKVNDSTLQSTLQSYLADNNCQATGPHCQVGPLMGVDITASDAGGWWLLVLIDTKNRSNDINDNCDAPW